MSKMITSYDESEEGRKKRKKKTRGERWMENLKRGAKKKSKEAGKWLEAAKDVIMHPKDAGTVKDWDEALKGKKPKWKRKKRGKISKIRVPDHEDDDGRV
jgi:hypothetical protein